VVLPSAEIQQMPLEQLLPSPYNVRSVRPDERIAALAQSLAEDGQKEPITVYLGNDGKYLILSGVTRYLAAQSLGWETLDVRVVTLGFADSPLAVVKASRLHNDTQRETELDHAFIVRTLREQNFTWKEISKALGYASERNVSRLNAFFKLPESILAFGTTKPEKFSASGAELLVRAVAAVGEEKTLALLERVSAEHPVSEIERRIRMMLARGKQRSVRRAYTRKVFHDGEEVGTFSVSNLPDRKKKVLLAVTVDEHLEERLSERLTRLLKEFEEDA
jgi:ParB family chromosome partitioning protein